MANVNIQLGYKDSAWFTANATLVLLAGQIVYLQQTGTYKIGDGVTQLQNLAFKGISAQTELVVATVVNNTGVNLLASNYQAVKVSTAQGQRLAVDFAQANNLRSYLSLPSLDDINPNSVIHSAKIVLPYDHSDVVKFNPGYQISVSVPNSATDDRLRIVAYGSIDTTNHVFIVDLRDHIQSIVSGKRLNLGLYISPKDFSTTATRIRFLNEGDNAPKLYLKVSSFKQ